MGMRNGMTQIDSGPNVVSFKGVPGFVASFPTQHQQEKGETRGGIWEMCSKKRRGEGRRSRIETSEGDLPWQCLFVTGTVPD